MFRRLRKLRLGYAVVVTYEDGTADGEVVKFPSAAWLAYSVILLAPPETVERVWREQEAKERRKVVMPS